MNQTRTAGWYPAPEGNGRKRYWDGNDWDGPSVLPPPAPPAMWIGLGVLGVLVSAVLVAIGLDGAVDALAYLGYALAVGSGIAVWIGVIAAGVRLGMRHAHRDRQ
ncbi:DUF2510 domain-containing protein [Nocardioides nanhaiensis]|uniref:DUF2510 domain-containing protein n=1 Tax=Nocardioides nanhaiensis TaxID=1476871 RepID=A0ABP8X2U6_9ACTN